MEMRRAILVMIVIHGVAILIFTRGFLLTRTELPFHSNCSDLLQFPCFSSDVKAHLENQTHFDYHQYCWTRPPISRLVIIVLDALRFDFVAPSSFFPESKPWMDKLRVLQKLASVNGSSARIFKAFADPPTTSLQRLKGLTTGGLPTFIDVGNSFGAPAIIEDNLINQLVQNGKRVWMMGDDTWIQLFPHHFEKSYPYPSFNVKDLHTVDNGCIDHLLPSLHQEDWDVLIAHFLGVDHAGHIFGVDSIPMIEKLEQYNIVLEKVVEVLESQSGPGGIHENTFLVVMGDHGQTLNGDHGGGSDEEVETSIFAMSFKKPPSHIPSEFDTSFCELDMDRKKVCVSSIQQVDFAVTMSALLGIPFPFGSIGRVNPELYALGADSRMESTPVGSLESQSALEESMENYVNLLCINSWQVKRYIDIYSSSSVIGFSSEDLSQISHLYAQAEKNWSHSIKNLLLHKNEDRNASLPALKRQIDAYYNFLSSVIELARLKWTEFDLKMMATGFGIMIISLYIHFRAIKRVNKAYGIPLCGSGDTEVSFEQIFSYIVLVIRACSFLSNSYILEEGKVANFLLATTGFLKLRHSIMKKQMLLEAVTFIILVFILRISIEIGLSKQAATSQFMSSSASWMLAIAPGHPLWKHLVEIVPLLSLVILVYMLYMVIARSSAEKIWKYIIIGSILNHLLIAVQWSSESNMFSLGLLLQGIGRNFIPQTIYAFGFGQLLLLVFAQAFYKGKTLNCQTTLVIKTVGLLSACSSTIIILSGKQGPLIALASVIGGYCIMRLEAIEQIRMDGAPRSFTLDHLSVTQWSLLAVCMFFATGHWCAFDGLRYGTAFVGFDEFVLLRQAIILAIETFGFSHILPVFGLPFLVVCQDLPGQTDQQKRLVFMRLFQIYLAHGLIISTAVTATILCVTIQRRHLMVWGLFAPKFVFDVVGLIITDVLIYLASLFYFDQMEDDKQQNAAIKDE